MNRRTLLRGMMKGTAVAVGLPVLECMLGSNGEALASGSNIPKRFGLFFWGNGNLPSRWTPTGTGANWQLSEQLMPLAPVKDRITVVTELDVKLANLLPHSSGAAGILSGAALNSSEKFVSATIDQHIAQLEGFKHRTVFGSLQTAATDTQGLSYSGENALRPAETDPWAFYNKVFGPSFREPGGATPPDPRLELRRSVVDAVLGDANMLRRRVGHSDKIRLDAHLDGLRDIENRLELAQRPIELPACVRADEPANSYADIDGRPQISARSRIMIDMLAYALACDQTRVFAHYLTKPVSDVLFEGVSAGHHDLTHNEPGAQNSVNEIVMQIMDEFRYMVEVFDSIDEGGQSLLDRCAILGTSEVSYGRVHAITNMPILLAGQAMEADGTPNLVTGRHINASKANATRLLLSLMHAVQPKTGSTPVAEFGQGEGYETRPLPAVLA